MIMFPISDKAALFFQDCSTLKSLPVFAVYLLCILLIPLWKKILPLFDLKPVMIFYNIICVLLSVIATALLFYSVWVADHVYSFEKNWYALQGLALYTISKNVELLDTVFMILRHKWRQVSFLHVFHHSSILMLGNYSYKYTPYPVIAVPIGLNSLVHVFLYAYYAKSAISVDARQITWKKLLTQFQIAQFLFGLVFSVIGYRSHGFCVYSMMYGLSMLVLFSNFYYHAYLKKKKSV